MKRGIILTGMIALAGALFLVSTNAADDGTTLGPFMAADQDFSHAESCVNCKSIEGKGLLDKKLASGKDTEKKQYHQENVLGINVLSRNADGTPKEAVLSGMGWLSSKHAQSMAGNSANANTYCAWCHAPTYEEIAEDGEDAKIIKSGKPGVACSACHPGHTLAGQFGTRYANYLPGSDESDADSWKPVPKVDEHNFDGKKANKQCLFCHSTYHGFAVDFHNDMVKSGKLECITCHMAVYNELSSGLGERFHNMKVFANGPVSCSNQGACHSFKKKQFAAEIAELMGGHTDKKNRRPSF